MEISGLFYHSDFTRNQFWSFWSHQKWHFWPFEQLWNLNFWELLQVKFFLKIKFKASKIVKTAVFENWNQPKLISHKIRVAGKWLNSTLFNIHSQNSQLGCLGLHYPFTELFYVFNYETDLFYTSLLPALKMFGIMSVKNHLRI